MLNYAPKCTMVNIPKILESKFYNVIQKGDNSNHSKTEKELLAPLSLISEGLGSVILSLRDAIMYRCMHTWVTLDSNLCTPEYCAEIFHLLCSILTYYAGIIPLCF